MPPWPAHKVDNTVTVAIRPPSLTHEADLRDSTIIMTGIGLPCVFFSGYLPLKVVYVAEMVMVWERGRSVGVQTTVTV